MLVLTSNIEMEKAAEFIKATLDGASVLQRRFEAEKNYSFKVLLPEVLNSGKPKNLSHSVNGSFEETCNWLYDYLASRIDGSPYQYIACEDVFFTRADYDVKEIEKSGIQFCFLDLSTLLLLPAGQFSRDNFHVLLKNTMSFNNVICLVDLGPIFPTFEVWNDVANIPPTINSDVFVACFDRESFLVLTV